MGTAITMLHYEFTKSFRLVFGIHLYVAVPNCYIKHFIMFGIRTRRAKEDFFFIITENKL